MSDKPVLPQELERLIFEMAAQPRIVSIPPLMRVARRVKIWVEPFLYRTLALRRYPNPEFHPPGYPVFERTRLLDTIRDDSFPGSIVRHLFIQSEGNEEPILSACPFVENLWVYPALDILPHIEAMPLKRLHCYLTTILDSDDQLDFTTPLFSRLTHLEIFDAERDGLPIQSYWKLPLIRTLTHLAFSEVDFLGFFSDLLDECAALRVLALLDSDPEYLDLNIPEALVQDIRFVAVDRVHTALLADWVIGAQTGIDWWSRAEELIAKRASGAVDPRQYWVGRV
ncbi:hypothetical protein C8R46DRAFT_1209986 [Mycena filopes]|nr:hypothetical protein C8R46DRAFT_1209986 [Mycena filopes]